MAFDLNTEVENRISSDENIQNQIDVIESGQLGPIKPTDAAPTPARNGNYTFSIGGAKPAWLTAEAGVTTVKAGDGVAVVFAAPSTYSYTHVDVMSGAELKTNKTQTLTNSETDYPSGKAVTDEIAQLAGEVSQIVDGAFVTLTNNKVGDFEAGLADAIKGDGEGVISSLTHNSVNPISGTHDIKFEVTTANILATDRPILNFRIETSLVVNHVFALSFKYKVNFGTPIIVGIYDGLSSLDLNKTFSGEGTFILTFVPKSTSADTGSLYFKATQLWGLQIDDLMVIDLTDAFGITDNIKKIDTISGIINTTGYFYGDKKISKELSSYILKKIDDAAEHGYEEGEEQTTLKEVATRDDLRDSLYYKLTTNANKDYPIAYDETAPSKGGGRAYILDAKISCNTKYRVNYAFRNRTTANTGEFDNTIGFYLFDTNGNPIEMVYFYRDENISIGKTGLYERIYDFPEYEMKLSVTYDLDAMPNYAEQYGNIPENAFYNKAPFMDILYEPYISVPEPLTTENIVDCQVGKVIGENLYIGSKYDDGNDIIIHFKKCMFNELMTFYKVALSVNLNAAPLINPERATDEILNVASSDNIGPLDVYEGGWTGANHSYGNDGVTRTAETLSFSFHADGKLLKDGDTIQAKTFEVRVKNRIYDPRITPPLGATMLTDELCIEDVVYRVANGSIFVSLTHTFTANNPVTYGYYGMQSMCTFESEVMTPEGMYTDFTTALTNMSFIKSDYPNFTRFIERNSAKTKYQSAYLIPTFGIGDKNLVGANDPVFLRSSGKMYHVTVSYKIANDGDIRYWGGIYNWFRPYSDDADKLVYTASLGGETYLFIDVKAAIDGYIDIPPHLTYLDYEIIEQSASITSIGDSISIGIKITASAAGSIVLKYKHNI